MIELLYERRTSMENPSTSLADADEWLYDSFGAGTSSSGVRVSRETALTYSAVWRAVTLISSTVAKLPLYIYRRTDGGKERATAHPSYQLVLFAPNAEMNAFTFWQTLVGHVLLEGNAYAYIVRDGSARPTELIPLPPQVTYPIRENGNLVYVVKVDTEWRRLLPENVLHIKGLGYDGLCGYSVLAKARDSFGLGIGAKEYQSRYLKNNARPSAVIQVPGPMKEDAQREFLRQWNEMHQGLENSHRTAILTNKAELKAFSINARDSQLLETREFEIREIANWFGLPPHKLGDSSRTAYNSLEQENQSFLDDTLDPWLVSIERECRGKLLTEREKAADSHLVEFMRQALLRADIAARFSAYHIAINDGLYSRDEIRAMENANAIPDGLGTAFYSQLNMAPLDKQAESQDPPDAQELLTVVQSLIADEIPPDAATIILQSAFPTMPPADIAKLVKASEKHEAPEPEPVEPPAAPEPDEDTPTVDDERQSWIKAIRPGIERDVMHVARRLRKHLVARASKADFLSAVSAAVVEYYDQFRAAAAGHYELCRKAGCPEHDAETLISEQLGHLEQDLRALFAKVPSEGLPAAAESRLMDYEMSLSKQIADLLTEPKP